MYLHRLGSVLGKAVNAWIDDHAQSMGAALSYHRPAAGPEATAAAPVSTQPAVRLR
jgi:hypothetical protein